MRTVLLSLLLLVVAATVVGGEGYTLQNSQNIMFFGDVEDVEDVECF